jgi:parallel beta-helix repeat protein
LLPPGTPPFAATWNTTEVRIYINGLLNNSADYSGTFAQRSDNLGVGCNLIGSNNHFNGSIDQAQIWNKSLSADEVQQLYFTKLNKYDANKWTVYTSQTNNVSGRLNYETYTYQAFATNSSSSLNSTEERTVTVQAATYYVDATNGNDSNDGLSQDTVWKTINKVNSETLYKGDSVLFKRGEEWREMLNISSSGTEGNLITFDAYGTGSNPVINPTEVVSNWEVYSGNIYVANVSNNVTQLFVNGTFYNLSHHPNSGFYNITGNTSKLGLFSENFTETEGQLINSTIFVMIRGWYIQDRTISAYNNTTQVVNWTANTTYTFEEYGHGLYLENKLWMLDSAGEWWYNSSSSQIYVWLEGNESPNNYTVEISNQSNGIYAKNVDYINIANLTIKQTKNDSLYLEDVGYSTIKGLTINDTGNRFIYLADSTNTTIKDNFVSRSRFNGIVSSLGYNVTITNNTVYHSGTIGKPRLSTAGIYLYETNDNIASNTLVRDNYIYDCAFAGIRIGYYGGHGFTVDRNFINQTCVILDDCGAIYSYHVNGSNTISNNILVNSLGDPPMKGPTANSAKGIYLDDLTGNFSIINNTVANVEWGINLHNSFNIDILNNTIFNSRKEAIRLMEDTGAPSAGYISGNNISGNVFHTNSSVYVVRINSIMGNTTLFGDFDYNYYAHPSYDSYFIRELENGSNRTFYTLNTWQEAKGNDTNSYDLESFYTINEYKVTSYGSEFIVNNNFDSGVDNWSQSSSVSQQPTRFSFNSTCPINNYNNGGCLFVEHNDSLGATLIFSNSFDIVSGQLYELRYTIQSNVSSAHQYTSTYVVPFVRKDTTPSTTNGYTGYEAWTKVNNSTLEYRHLVTGEFNLSSRLDFQMHQANTTIWLDDVYLTEINSIVYNDKSDDFLLLYNNEVETQTFTLSQDYTDIYGTKVSGSVTLAPYTSQLLLAGYCNNDYVCNNLETYSTCPNDCTAPTVTSTGGGGSSSSIPLICAPNTIKCINSLHYKECLEYGTTNKWSEVKDVKEGYQCQFGKIVEIEEAAKVAEETQPKEETQTPAVEEPENKLLLTGSAFFQNIKGIGKDLTWLWLTLIITISLSIIYFLMRRK